MGIWSAGCIMAELFLRKALFQGRGEFDMLAKIFEKRGTPTEDSWRDASALPNFVEFTPLAQVPIATVLPAASLHAQALIGELLSLDPKQRPAADDALRRSSSHRQLRQLVSLIGCLSCR